ncbi:MAG: galactitol-1-phosphate 5-dehydrogenase [Candidatus Aenigmarchaeota archaeon]|nr:galactitol-1-phosphate 5-dehydrogenase [Candidatus Aenigmarchaeota archaeon]
MMYAGVLHGPGKIEYQEVDYPEISGNEVIVGVKYAGICGSDIQRVMVKGAYHHPLVPGHEFSGVIEDAGDSKFHTGQKVTVYPLIPCKKCHSCDSGSYHLCDNYNYLGSRCDGGFAEFVKCPSENIIPLPENISLENAAFTEPASVSFHGVSKAGIKEGDTVVVYGLGTIGMLVAQWARLMGAGLIIGVDRNSYKHLTAKSLGVDYCISSDENSAEIIKDLTGNRGADCAFECAGSASTQEKCVIVSKKGGRIVMLGNSESDFRVRKENVPQILRKELSIYGSWNSTIKDDWTKSIDAMKNGKIRCADIITHRKNLSEIKQVFEDLHQKSYPYIKVIFVI